MADNKTTRKTTQSNSTTKSSTITRPPQSRTVPPHSPTRRHGFFGAIQNFLEDPDSLKQLQQRLPSWSDEVGAIGLMIMGVLSFAAILNPTGEAALSSTIAQSLSQVFGLGAYFVTLAVFLLGIILLLPKIGIRMRFNWVQIVALELAFVSLVGLFHLLSFDSEGRALARAGQGGGYAGWAISSLLTSLVGLWPAIFVCIGLLVYSFMLFWGITRRDIRQFLNIMARQLGLWLAQLRPPRPQPAPMVVGASGTGETIINPDSASASEALPEAQPAPDTLSVTQPGPEPSVPPMLSQWQGTTPAFTPSVQRPMITPPSDLPGIHTEIITPIAHVDDFSPVALDSPPASPPFGTARVMAGEALEPLAEINDSDTSPEAAENSVSGLITEESGAEPQYKTLIINGETVQVPMGRAGIGGEVSPIMSPFVDANRRRMEGQRYFTVDGFQDRYLWHDKRDMVLPPLELLRYADLKLPTEDEVNNNARIITNTMHEFDIDADVIDVRIGPTVTQYAVSPIKEVVDANGTVRLVRTRVSKIAALADDLALALSTKRLRIQAPVPGSSYVGIEVPNREPSLVSLRSVMETETFYRKRDVPLIVPLGRDVSGDPIVASLASMPHVLIAGTTGSGKSVCLTSMIAGLVMNNRPDTLRMILLDPKMVELNRFAGLPHLLGPVEIETERIIGVLRWAAREMDRRYKLLELENARNLEAYNQQLGEERRTEHLPYIVIVVDEIGDLMMTRPEETEKTLTRLAQKARAAGMHLVVATQRPSVDVITGLIKANFPARISFAVASGTDSRVILDAVGAETLVGRGDMLFQAPDAAAPQRLQGCFISDEEIYEILMYWKAWQAEQSASLGTDDQPASPPWEQSLTRYEALERLDPMLEEALQMVVAEGRASVSQVQKRLGIDYARAARIMDSLRELGIIGGTLAGGTNRKVLVKSLEEARRMIHNNRRGN